MGTKTKTYELRGAGATAGDDKAAVIAATAHALGNLEEQATGGGLTVIWSTVEFSSEWETQEDQSFADVVNIVVVRYLIVTVRAQAFKEVADAE